MITKQCLNCGKGFQCSNCKKHRAKFCSRQCLGFYGGRKRNKQATLARKCKICGESFTVLRCVARTGRGSYCSYQCSGRAKSSNPNQVWSRFKCKWCGNFFEKRTYRAKDSANHFCSQKCNRSFRTSQVSKYVVQRLCVICGQEYNVQRSI